MSTDLADLTTLPLEIILEILTYLPLSDIFELCTVSQKWNLLITTNEENIFRSLSIYHQFITPSIQYVEDARRFHFYPEWLENTHTWKDYFMRRLEVEKYWLATAAPHDNVYDNRLENNTTHPVHRFKIDEEEQTIISTSTVGGLAVRTWDAFGSESRLLFALPANYVVEYSHVEYSSGFVVFNRRGEEMEVWRRSNDHRLAENPLPGYSPEPSQLRGLASAFSANQINGDSEFDCHRGRLVPFSVLQPPNPTRAFRFVYPVLLLGSPSAREAYLYDIPSSRLIQTVNLYHESIADLDPNFRINYVEIHDRYIFVCIASKVLIYSRERDKEQKSKFILAFPPDGIQVPLITTTHPPHNPQTEQENYGDLVRIDMETQEGNVLDLEDTPSGFLNRSFSAVHTSPDGRDLVAMNHSGHVYLIQDFEDALPPAYVAPEEDDAILQKLQRSARCLEFNGITPLFNLAVGEGKFAIVTDAGVSVYNLESFQHVLFPSSAERGQNASGIAPLRFAHAIKQLDSYDAVINVIWMALTTDSLWITWNPGLWPDPEIRGAALLRVKFYPEVDTSLRRVTHDQV